MSPTTLLITECKDPFFHEITLTPTIPVRKNSTGKFLSVTFYLPKGLWLVNKEKCSVQLEGTKSVTVKVGATCTTLYGLKKLSVITPKINSFGSKFWCVFGLPTIWVCTCEYYVFSTSPLLLSSSSSSYHHHHQQRRRNLYYQLFSIVMSIIVNIDDLGHNHFNLFQPLYDLSDCVWLVVDEPAKLALNYNCFAT